MKASDNPFPSLLVVEGTTPTAPAAGDQRLFVDSADHKLKRINSAGAVTSVEPTGGGTQAFVGARAYATTGQSIPSGTPTAISLDGESYDSGTLHSTTTNNSRITVPSAGKYLVVAGAGLTTGGTVHHVRIHVNGTYYSLGVFTSPSGGGPESWSDIISLAANDYVELAIFQASGSTQTATSGSNNCFLSVALLGT